MKPAATLYIFFFINFLLYGQYDKIRDGAYRNIGDFRNSKPLDTCEYNFSPKKRMGTIFYKVNCKDRKIRKYRINLEYYVIKENNALYLNTARLGMSKGYIKIDTLLPFSYFRGVPMRSLKQDDIIANYSYWFGITGGTIAAVATEIKNRKKVNYVINIESGIIHLLTRNYLINILASRKEYFDLLKKFVQEPDQESIDVLKSYLGKINDIAKKL